MINADGSPLKRSFLDALGHEPYIDIKPAERNGTRLHSIGSYDCWNRPTAFPAKRRSISYSGPCAMTVETSSVVQPTFPSFMAVFGGKGTTTFQEDVRNGGPSAQPRGTSAPLMTTKAQPRSHYFPNSTLQHRGSINSLTSNSSESSPTTTVSTFDSPSITDQSPSSSPESPSSALPLSPFQKMMRSPEEEGRQHDDKIDPSRQPADSQNIGGKNLKNLSLNMDIAAFQLPTTSSSVENFHLLPTPISPMKEPLRTGRKKPTNLTIRTPGFDQLTFARNTPDVPPTPGQRPFLQHIQSSPSLPSLMSPSLGPTGGMGLPMPPFLQGHSRSGSQQGSQSSFGTQSSFGIQSIGSSLGDLREEDIPKSQETPVKGYLAGPVQIYDSGVFLYLEPTVEEASQFDTVINVAKEIKNPFEGLQTGDHTVMSVWRNKEDRSNIPEPQTAISERSFKSAFEWPQFSDTMTPTTPTQESSSSHKQPEYIHVPWDHNSEIVNDLFPLCEIIDERVRAGKKVLVHCQLGVSRSASLVIAYGLYKGYQPTFPTMYDAVKARSPWVGPNMSLIYQLGDFRRQVERNEHITRKRRAPEHWFKNGRRDSDKAITPTNSTPVAEAVQKPFVKSILMQRELPPVPRPTPPLRLNKKLPPVPLFSQDPARDSQPKPQILQPVAYAIPARNERPLVPAASSATYTSNSSSRVDRPLPLRRSVSPARDIPPHRPRANIPSGLVISQPKSQMDLAMQDVPSTPSLFSPRATEFMVSPFGLTSAGDLHTGSTLTMPARAFDAGQASPAEVDPRSPHQPDDTVEILRHIDDVL